MSTTVRLILKFFALLCVCGAVAVLLLPIVEVTLSVTGYKFEGESTIIDCVKAGFKDQEIFMIIMTICYVVAAGLGALIALLMLFGLVLNNKKYMVIIRWLCFLMFFVAAGALVANYLYVDWLQTSDVPVDNFGILVPTGTLMTGLEIKFALGLGGILTCAGALLAFITTCCIRVPEPVQQSTAPVVVGGKAADVTDFCERFNDAQM